ncbi:MAG TPA: hypothetical protein VLA56_13540, partial [Pseudomonadales bacterium]|nr:hypothetical protein [Pseudomonadales bacterium]
MGAFYIFVRSRAAAAYNKIAEAGAKVLPVLIDLDSLKNPLGASSQVHIAVPDAGTDDPDELIHGYAFRLLHAFGKGDDVDEAFVAREVLTIIQNRIFALTPPGL